MKQVGNYTFFFTEKDPFSNWFLRDFTVHSITFNCMEQYMMYAKARLFGDNETANRILAEPSQKKQKALGREVKGFTETIWVDKRKRIVVPGLLAKFRQNSDLAEILLGTEETILVEASPYDSIWGVKLRMDDPLILDPQNWRGLNLLGELTMKVRRVLVLEKQIKEVLDILEEFPSIREDPEMKQLLSQIPKHIQHKPQ